MKSQFLHENTVFFFNPFSNLGSKYLRFQNTWSLNVDLGSIFWNILTLHFHNSKLSLPATDTLQLCSDTYAWSIKKQCKTSITCLYRVPNMLDHITSYDSGKLMVICIRIVCSLSLVIAIINILKASRSITMMNYVLDIGFVRLQSYGSHFVVSFWISHFNVKGVYILKYNNHLGLFSLYMWPTPTENIFIFIMDVKNSEIFCWKKLYTCTTFHNCLRFYTIKFLLKIYLFSSGVFLNVFFVCLHWKNCD